MDTVATPLESGVMVNRIQPSLALGARSPGPTPGPGGLVVVPAAHVRLKKPSSVSACGVKAGGQGKRSHSVAGRWW